jgi:hypothetical protein
VQKYPFGPHLKNQELEHVVKDLADKSDAAQMKGEVISKLHAVMG